jgi:hypothetical protein
MFGYSIIVIASSEIINRTQVKIEVDLYHAGPFLKEDWSARIYIIMVSFACSCLIRAMMIKAYLS